MKYNRNGKKYSTALVVVPEKSSRPHSRAIQKISPNLPLLFRFIFILSIVAICVSLVLLYIWQRVYTNDLVGEIQTLRVIEEQLKLDNQDLQVEVIKLSGQERIEKIAIEQRNMHHADLNSELIMKEVDLDNVSLSSSSPR